MTVLRSGREPVVRLYIETLGRAGNMPIPPGSAGPPCVQVLVASPSTAIVWPVMKSESAEARKTRVPTRSSGTSYIDVAERLLPERREQRRVVAENGDP